MDIQDTNGARDAKKELTATFNLLFCFLILFFFVPQHFEHLIKLKGFFCGWPGGRRLRMSRVGGGGGDGEGGAR